MITIIFEAHSTTTDNEAKLCSGWNDVDLSELGYENIKDLRKRYEGKAPDAVFCSDLQRSYKTAAIAFEGTNTPIIIDKRLRECDYGDDTQASKRDVDPQKAERLETPFPNGESYQDTSKRMLAFLKELKENYDGQTVMIIGHRATQYGLEEHILNKNLKEVVTAPWAWQPGWTYTY